MWFIPREQDVRLVQSVHRDLHTVVSPFVTLSPPARACSSLEEMRAIHNATHCSTAFEAACATATTVSSSVTAHTTPTRAASEESADYSPPCTTPSSAQDTSTFFALRDIPAGMFILSIPTEAVFFARPPPASDVVLSYFMHVEDLIGQLVAAAEEDGQASHKGYVRYLMQSVVPCRNLPFLTREEMQTLMPTLACPATDATTQGEAFGGDHVRVDGPHETHVRRTTHHSHPAWQLWQFFHEDMAGLPLSPYLRERLSKEEYAWWVSLVLSRREGAATYIPLVDKFNHDPSPTCYYTMSTPDTFCAIDVLDNLMAGVSGTLLYQPHVHVFTIHHVRAGEPLTLCYASATHGRYTYPTTTTTHPASLSKAAQSWRRDGLGASGESGDADEAAMLSLPLTRDDKRVTRDTHRDKVNCGMVRKKGDPDRTHAGAVGGGNGGVFDRRTDNHNNHADHDARAWNEKDASCTGKEHERRAACAVREMFGDTDGSVVDSSAATDTMSFTDVRTLGRAAGAEEGVRIIPGQHAGRQEVHTEEGRATWQLQWGFVPPCDAVYSASDLQQVATIVAERRVDTRRLLFPTKPKRSH